MENSNSESKKASRSVGGLLFTGCMFLGMAGGWYFGNMLIGLFAGMGVGFIMMAVVIMSAANKR